MEKSPRYIDSNPCDVDWNKMKVNENGDKRFCSSCSQFVHDLTQKDVFEFSQKDLEGKCISVYENQLHNLMFIHPLKRFAAALFLVFGSSLFIIPKSFAQEIKSEVVVDSLVIKGRVVNSEGKPLKGISVSFDSFFDDGLKVKSDSNGEFLIKTSCKFSDKDNHIRLQFGKKGMVKSIFLTEGRNQDIGDVRYITAKKNHVNKRFRRNKRLSGAYSN